jgi:hypothetical protein
MSSRSASNTSLSALNLAAMGSSCSTPPTRRGAGRRGPRCAPRRRCAASSTSWAAGWSPRCRAWSSMELSPPKERRLVEVLCQRANAGSLFGCLQTTPTRDHLKPISNERQSEEVSRRCRALVAALGRGSALASGRPRAHDVILARGRGLAACTVDMAPVASGPDAAV